MQTFAIDNQNAPTFLIFATLSASFIGPGYSIGLTEQGFNFGLFSFYAFIGFSIQLILTGYYIAPRLRKYVGAFTVGDVIGFHYGKISRLITGIISVLFGAGLVGVVAFAAGNLLFNVFGIPNKIGILISTIFVVFYSFYGGMRTVVFTDIFQFLSLAIAMPILLIFIFIKAGSIDTIISNLPSEHFTFLSTKSPKDFFGLFLGFLLGETLVPPYTNRAFVSKDSQNAKIGFVFSGIFSIMWCAMVVVVGISAKALHPDLQSANSFLFMVNNYLPVGVLGLMIVAIVSILMSTQDSFLNSASVSFVRDIVHTFNKNISTNNSLFFSKLITVVIGFLGIIFATTAKGLIDALMLIYMFWAPTIVLPLIIAVLLPDKVKSISGFASISISLIFVLVWEWILKTPFGFPTLITGIVVNQVVFWTIQFLPINIENNKYLTRNSGCLMIEK
jgi:SSS family solute:Na+ symporter